MSFFGNLFDEVQHDAKPLLSAAAKWAEEEGLIIVRAIALEIRSKGPTELVALFNHTLGKVLGFLLPNESALTETSVDLLITALARDAAQKKSGTKFRAAVLNTGIEQAVLLAKGQAGDTDPKPATLLRAV